MRAQTRQENAPLTVDKQPVARAAGIFHRSTEIGEGIDQGVHVGGETSDFGDAPEMREQHLPRSEGQQSIDRGVELVRFELHRRGRRKNERALFRIELAIRDAERIAREYRTGTLIDDAEVMARVARGVEKGRRWM